MKNAEQNKDPKAALPIEVRQPPTLAFDQKGADLNVEVHGDHSRIRFATGNEEVFTGLLRQLVELGSQNMATDVAASNFALGFVDAMEPRDAAESLLLTQMAATHRASMMMARRLNLAKTVQQQDSAERALNKLLRSYSAQMETLKRYRSKGQQVVRVERVTVETGAQAVVGNVTHGGRAENER